MKTLPAPRYSIWQAISAALALATRAMDEVRALAARPGLPGKDGLGFDDLEEVLEDGGRVNVKRYFRDGKMVKEIRLKTAQPVYRGVFDATRKYDHGDLVTFGGSLFSATRDTEDKPETSDAWQLATKRGRDGKDGKDGVLKPLAGPVKLK